MWTAHLICSGADCTAEIEVEISSLDDLDRYGCECGYAYVLLSISEAAPALLGR